METIYTYSLASDFSGGISPHILLDEITANVGIVTVCSKVDLDDDDVYIAFDDVLQEGEQTVLNGLISTHIAHTDPLISIMSAGSPNTELTLYSYQTANRTITVPDYTDTLAVLDAPQIFLNKDMTSSTNTFILDAADVKTGTFSDGLIAVSNITQHVGSIIHQNLSGVGTNTHSQIDTHIANSNIHETITASNNIGDYGIFSTKSGSDLQFKSLTEGSNITMSADANSITINSSTGFTWQGEWVSGNYNTYDAVYYSVDGQSYVCKLNTVSNEVPTNITYWDLLAKKGDDAGGGAISSILVSETIDTSTTGSSYSRINGMHTTPTSGTYLVTFSASGGNQTYSRSDSVYAIHLDGSIISHSERNQACGPKGGVNRFGCNLHTQALVTLNGSQIVEVMYHTAGVGTFVVHSRSMILIRLS